MQRSTGILLFVMLGACQDLDRLVLTEAPHDGGEPRDAGVDRDAGAAPCFREVGWIGQQEAPLKEIGRRIAWSGDQLFIASFTPSSQGPPTWIVLRAVETATGWEVDRRADGRGSNSDGFLVEGFSVTPDDVWIGTVNDDDRGTLWRLSHDLEQRSGPIRTPEDGREFGYAIVGAGTRLFVGDPSHDGQKGAVYVYDTATTDPVLVATINSFEPEAGDRFGQALALDGDRLLVGVPTCPIGSRCDRAGSVQQFRVDATSATYVRTLRPSTSTSRGFGGTLAWLDENEAVIGAPSTYVCVDRCYSDAASVPQPGSAGCAPDQVPCEYVGAAYISRDDVVTEYSVSTLPKRLARRGGAVATSNEWLVVGAFGDSSCSTTTERSIGCPSTGAVHIFPRDLAQGDAYYLRAPDFPPSARFGFSVAMSGRHLAVGSPLHCGARPGTPCSASGVVHVFEGCR